MLIENPTYDTRINSSAPATSGSTLGFFNVGESSDVVYRSLMEFKLDKAPTELQIATLGMYWEMPNASRKNDTIIEIYRAAQFDQKTVGWKFAETGGPWNKEGGDWFDMLGTLHGNVPFASTIIKTTDKVGKYITFDLTNYVKGVQSGVFSNTGLFIKAKTEKGDYLQFNSIEAGNGKNLPTLVYAGSNPAPVTPIVQAPEVPITPTPATPVPTPITSVQTVLSVGQGQTYTTIQDAVNAAVSGDLILVHAGIYDLPPGHIVLKSGITLSGVGPTTVLKGGAETGGVQGSRTADGWISCDGLTDIEISNFTFSSSATGITDGGLGDGRNCIYLNGCKNVKIHDCTVQPYVYNDFLHCYNSSNVQVYNCSGQSGHDFVEFLKGSSKCRANNNNVVIQTNSAFRNDGTTDCEIDHNNVTGIHGTGWCICEVENEVTGLDIHNNIFHDYMGSSGNAVTQPVNAKGTVSVHDNILINVGEVKIGTSTNNIVNPIDSTIADYTAQGYGYSAPVVVTPTPANVSITGTGTNDEGAVNKALLTAAKTPGSVVTLNGPLSFDMVKAIAGLTGVVMQGNEGTVLTIKM